VGLSIITYNHSSISAVIIGCCPAFAVLVNAFRSNASYDSRGYRRQTDWNADRTGGSRLELKSIGKERISQQVLGLGSTDLHWTGVHSSQERLRTKHDGIMVSTTVMHQQDSIDRFERP
jgi:hypothetical protein